MSRPLVQSLIGPVVQIVCKIITRDSEMKGDILEDLTDMQINIKSNSVMAVLKVEIGHKYLQRTRDSVSCGMRYS